MPRGNVSKLEYLRPEITELFLSGVNRADLVAKYKQVPRATIYRWLKEIKDISETTVRQPESDVTVSQIQSQSKGSLNIVTLPMSDATEDTLPDFQYLKRKLRRIINSDGDSLSRNDNIRVNAISCYLKVVVIEHGNKNIALEDEDELEDEETDYSKLSDEELTELYHKKLKSI